MRKMTIGLNSMVPKYNKDISYKIHESFAENFNNPTTIAPWLFEISKQFALP